MTTLQIVSDDWNRTAHKPQPKRNGLVGWLKGLGARIRNWRERRQSLPSYVALDRHTLRDIGVNSRVLHAWQYRRIDGFVVAEVGGNRPANDNDTPTHSVAKAA